MAHQHQLQFIKTVSEYLSDNYTDKKILEIGSYDVNGTIRPYFENSSYIGVDLTEGPGVDVVCDGDKVDYADETFDLTVSCECFEHNPHWLETFLNMHRMTKAGGIVIFTCATTGRLEHGTTRTEPTSSPGTQSIGWDYYRNLTEKDFIKSINIDNFFASYFFQTNKHSCDLYFIGTKTGSPNIFHFDKTKLKIKIIEMIEQLQLNLSSQSRYPKSLLFLSQLSLLPLRLAARLPERLFQNFAVYYSRLIGLIKTSVKLFLDKVHK
jgi:SAM-dependent methyltransferase